MRRGLGGHLPSSAFLTVVALLSSLLVGGLILYPLGSMFVGLLVVKGQLSLELFARRSARGRYRRCS